MLNLAMMRAAAIASAERGLHYTSGGLAYADFSDNGDKYRIIAQNPQKFSPWARMARQGHKVWQVVQLPGWTYRVVVVDKVWYEYGSFEELQLSSQWEQSRRPK